MYLIFIDKIRNNFIVYLLHIFYVVVIPLLFFATYWEVRKRIFTNICLTMSKLGKKLHVKNIKIIVQKNLHRLIVDRLQFLLFLLPFWLLKRIILKSFTPVGLEKLDTVLKRGNGAILFSCHIGPYYLTPALLALLGYKVVTVERLGFIEEPLVNYHIKKLNKLMEGNVLATTTIYDDLLLRKLKRHLQQGKIVYIMGDYYGFNYKGSYVKFLGYDIVPGSGIAWLHKKTGTSLLPIVTVYNSENGDETILKICDELKIEKKQSIESITQQVYSTMEYFILRNPEKWSLWLDYHLMLSPEAREK